MILKEIVINGFKSFANRTRIELGPGVTTIVGPNGCGKSNVVDAIRWVLGEQSAKALRGGNMQDVIFSGTDQRAAMAMCEVTLLFTDCEKELGTAFNEVEITRRVSRDGTSNYYLNGKNCRLKDIQELFMNTGVGRVSYSFMVQGQIDQILSTNPAERRVIFEEAAGVTRYKAQRREALNKLGQVDLNLSRVEDVIAEVGRQIGSLKRQASKAIRYKRIKHRMSHLELAYCGYDYEVHQKVIKKLNEKVEGVRESVEKLQGMLELEEAVVIEKKEERGKIYEALQNRQQEIFEMKSQKDQLENRGKLALVRKSDTQARIVEMEKEIKGIEKQIEELEMKTKDDSYFKEIQLNLVSTSDATFQEKSVKMEAIQKRLLEAEERLQSKKKSVLNIEGEANRLSKKSSELEVILNTNTNQVADLNFKQKEAQEHQEVLRAQYEKVQEALKSEEKTQDRMQEQLKELQLEVVKRTEGVKEIQKCIQEQDKQVTRLNAQVSVLEALQSKFEGFSDGAKAILQGKLGGLLENGEYELLSKGIEVEEKFMKALETLLGQAIDAIALEEVGQVILVTKSLEEKDLGRACLHVEIGKSSKKEGNLELPKFLKSAQEVVKIKEGKFKGRWERLLEGCYLAENLEDFIEFWQKNPEFEFQLLATQQGELVDGRGLIYGGIKKGKSEGSGFLQREKEIRASQQKLNKEKKVLEELLGKAKELQSQVHDVEEALEEVRRKVSIGNEKILGLKAENRQSQIAMERNQQMIERTVDQLKQISNIYEESQGRLKEGIKELEQIQEKMYRLREEVNKEEEGIIRIRQERDEERESLSQMRVELAERRQKLQVIDDGLCESENRKSGLVNRREQREKDIHRLADQVQELSNEAQACEMKVEVLQKALREAVGILDNERQGLLTIEEFIKKLDEKVASWRKELHVQETGLKTCEVELVKERSQVEYMGEKVRTEYELRLEDVNWKEQMWLAQSEIKSTGALDEIEEGEEILVLSQPKIEDKEPTEEDFRDMDNTDWQEVQKEVKALREKISNMGAVNLVAIEEYAELKDRYEFLGRQCKDLKGAKEQLIGAIEEINLKSQALFKDTFEKVKENFKFTFDALFGGGVADLELIETPDMLEAGIEIIARPPGTKLKNLSLLSGGQKTMTAVALLFAIYKVKPSPFCVLDELDAPLDDANIGRFTTMLRGFTKYSQFLVVSHNRRTIAASDTIYGVTMQERGVSALISMRFNKKDKEPAERIDELIEV